MFETYLLRAETLFVLRKPLTYETECVQTEESWTPAWRSGTKPPKNEKKKGKITHPLSGAQVGTRVHRSRNTRITMTHDFSPLALA